MQEQDVDEGTSALILLGLFHFRPTLDLPGPSTSGLQEVPDSSGWRKTTLEILGRNKLQSCCSWCWYGSGGRLVSSYGIPALWLQLGQPQPAIRHLMSWRSPAWNVAGCHGLPVGPARPCYCCVKMWQLLDSLCPGGSWGHGRH